MLDLPDNGLAFDIESIHVEPRPNDDGCSVHAQTLNRIIERRQLLKFLILQRK